MVKLMSSPPTRGACTAARSPRRQSFSSSKQTAYLSKLTYWRAGQMGCVRWEEVLEPRSACWMLALGCPSRVVYRRSWMASQLRRLWQGWKRFGRKMGDFQARIFLTIFYFVILAPFALVMRLADPLGLKKPGGWHPPRPL